jgi:DedD protein
MRRTCLHRERVLALTPMPTLLPSMPLPSFLQRLRDRSTPPSSAALSAADIENARAQARRRMIGMTVLVVLAVAVLSWLLETEPRPLPTDVRIVADAASEPVAPVRVAEPVPRPAVRDAVIAQVPVVPTPVTEVPRKPSPNGVSESLTDDEVIVADTPKPVAKPVPVELPKPKPVVSPPVVKPIPVKPPVKPEVKKPDAKPVTKPAAKPEAASAPATATRYVVQVGAFTDVATARATRLKVEALGIKTYTQVVQTPAGRKIRVRMGPYASEAEAQKALTAARKAGLVGGILTF